MRHQFQTDCALIKDWGAPLESCRKEFKNTTRSFDPLTLTINVNSWHDLVGGDIYPTALSTPSDSGGQSSIAVNSLIGTLPTLHFAGLKYEQAIESEDWDSDRASIGSSVPNTASSVGLIDASMDNLSAYIGDSVPQLEAYYSDGQDSTVSLSSEQSALNSLDMSDDPIEWNFFIDSGQMVDAEHEEKDLRSPISWDSDPGNSDGALN